MPLARTVFRRAGSTRGFDDDAATYVRAVQSADGAALEPAIAFAINNFVIGCKSDGIWTALKACCVMMGARTLSGALTTLVGKAPTNYNFVSGDYSRTTGLVGNGTSKYLDTNRANSADGQNDNHNAVYVTTMETAGSSRNYISADFVNTGSNNLGRSSLSPYNVFVRSRISSATVQSGTDSHTGLLGHTRSASASHTLRAGGTNYTITSTSQAPGAPTVLVYARADSPLTYSSGRLAFYSIGSNIDLAKLDTRVSDLHTAIGNALA